MLGWREQSKLLGDFNDSSTSSSRLTQYMTSLGFTQLVQMPTTDSWTTSTAISLMLLLWMLSIPTILTMMLLSSS